MPRSYTRCKYQGRWRSAHEIAQLTGLGAKKLRALYQRGELTEERVDALLQEKRQREDERARGLSAELIWKRINTLGWDEPTARNTPPLTTWNRHTSLAAR